MCPHIYPQLPGYQLGQQRLAQRGESTGFCGVPFGLQMKATYNFIEPGADRLWRNAKFD